MPLIASFVHRRLFPESSDLHADQAGNELAEGVGRVVSRILEEADAAAAGQEVQPTYFRSLDEKYLSSNETEEIVEDQDAKKPFSYVGKAPDFLQRQRDAHAAMTQEIKRGSSVLASRIQNTKLYAAEVSESKADDLSRKPGSSLSGLGRSSGGLSSLIKPAEERKAPIMIPLSQVPIPRYPQGTTLLLDISFFFSCLLSSRSQSPSLTLLPPPRSAVVEVTPQLLLRCQCTTC